MEKEKIMAKLPGKNCGLCGFKTCEEFTEIVAQAPDSLKRCIYIDKEAPEKADATEAFKSEITWKDQLGREFDFILDKFPGESGPKETIILFNPANVEKLKLKKGDIIYGRPAWISCGCPVTHVGVIVEEPDYFNGVVTWCVVGPMLARKGGINIGYYNTTAYEGIVKHKKTDLVIGKGYYFQPRYCMLQWRHCGLVNQLAKTKDGLRVRLEGLWIA
jgi:uncharacterized Fe-S cluster-containing protein